MVGKEIKCYMDSQGIKYSYVAEKTGIKLSIFSAMINSKRKITVEEYFSICEVLQVNSDYFAEKITTAS